MVVPLFTTRINNTSQTIDDELPVVPCENDLVIDDMDDFEYEIPSRADKIVLVRKT